MYVIFELLCSYRLSARTGQAGGAAPFARGAL
jgi:hypothetical protein